jgi:hypothetical protein
MHTGREIRRYAVCYAVLSVSMVILALALLVPVELPIGPSFWDSYIYIDGAYRLEMGQQIYRDFHPPVGPLSYVLFGFLQALFPEGNVVLLIQWCMIIVTAPVMAVICWYALQRGTFAAFALLIPYLMFSVLPFNVMNWNVFPGVDGFSYYNRHGAVLLYLLVASLFFIPSRLALTAVVSILLLCLAFTKINAFVAAGGILFAAVLSRRIGLATAVAVAALCLSVVAALELTTGVVSAYLQSVFRLLANNSGVLLQNILLTGTLRFDVIFAASLLSLYLLVAQLRGGENLVAAFERGQIRAPAPNRLDQDWAWLGVLIAANILYESQNFGSAAFISLWPFLVMLLVAGPTRQRPGLSILAVLVLVIAVPTAAKVLHAAVRATATTIRDISIETPNMPQSIRMSGKELILQAAAKSRPILASGRDTYRRYAEAEILPAYWLYFDHRFQVNVLQTMDEAITAIRQREADLGRLYEVIDLRDFANPVTAAMQRTPARGVAIGGDPYRSVLPLTDAETVMLAETELVLIPTCPVTSARKKLLDLYEEAFQGFQRIELTACFDALEHPKYGKD